MGLNLLGVLRFRLPSLDLDTRSLGVPPLLQAYLAGFTFALAASPCSTPILATLLAYTSTQPSPFLGGSLLLAYTSGYVAPLLFAASATVRRCHTPCFNTPCLLHSGQPAGRHMDDQQIRAQQGTSGVARKLSWA